VLALEVELAMLAERGLTFTREDYVTRFMGLSYDSFHQVIDAEAVKRQGAPLPHDFRTELAARLRQTMIERLTGIPGVEAAVAATDLPKAVASSSTREGLERKLRQVGLWEHFGGHVYSAEHVTNAKPAPDLFLHAAQQLGVAPADCLVIEDSVNGVKAGLAAGMTVWGFLGGGHADDGLAARLAAAGVSKVLADWPDAARQIAVAVKR
jgi:HAD superfamily hydrolase (TIGR01509 family)